MGEGDEGYPRHREHGFGKAVTDCDRRGHESKSGAADDERPDASVAQDTVTERDKSHHECHCKADPMDRRREKRLSPQTEDSDHKNAQDAVHGAQPAEKNPGTVEPIPNRGKSAMHAPANMLCCNIVQEDLTLKVPAGAALSDGAIVHKRTLAQIAVRTQWVKA